METDNEVSGTGNSFTTEFRQYDPRLGRWKSCDAMRHWYPAMSAYAYASNIPTVGKDDNGLYTIFVNGYIYGKEPGKEDDITPGRPYWLKPTYFKNDDPEEFIKAAHSYFGDGIGKYINGTGADMTSSAYSRQKMGKQMASEIAWEVLCEIRKLNNDSNPDNDVKEINFVTHSMGGATAEGLIEEFMKFPELAKLMANGEIVHMSAADADGIVISENSKMLKRTQINFTHDETLGYADNGAVNTGGYQIPGVERFIVVEADVKKMYPNYDQNKYGYYDFHNTTKSNKLPWMFLEKYNEKNYSGKKVMKYDDLNIEDTLPKDDERTNTSNKG